MSEINKYIDIAIATPMAMGATEIMRYFAVVTQMTTNAIAAIYRERLCDSPLNGHTQYERLCHSALKS